MQDTIKLNINQLEKHGIVIKILRIFIVPIMNHLPSLLIQRIMRKSSKDADTVVKKGGSTHALEAMYTRYNRRLFSRGIVQGIADSFWHHVISQPKALRNRLSVVHAILQSQVKREIDNRKQNLIKEPVTILSIAGGSSRSIIYTLKALRDEGEKFPVKVVTIDKDVSALEIGKKLAEERGLGNDFTWIGGKANELNQKLPDQKFDIVEIVGLLDYFDDERAVRLLDTVKSHLKSEGWIVAANVAPNSEMRFVENTGWPKMYYRTPDNFMTIFKKAGFLQCEIIKEPLGVHMIIIGKK
jgi:ubiquinone/menaquinone biosynthesis C-methylase UbiE